MMTITMMMMMWKATTPRENEGIGNNSGATDMTIRNDDNLEMGR